MDTIEKTLLLAELENSCCELNHGPGTNPNDYPASDYIVVPIGYKESDIKEVSSRELVIPVCFECAQALINNEWTLLYCFECSSNRWVARKLSKNHYRHHILWLRGCPDCTNTFGGLFFNDIPEVQSEVHFLSNPLALHVL